MSCLGGLLRKKRAYVFWPFRLVHQRGVAQTVLVLLIIPCRGWGVDVGLFHNGTPRLLTPKKGQADSDSPFGFGAVAWGHVLKNRFRFNVSSFLGVRYYDGS